MMYFFPMENEKCSKESIFKQIKPQFVQQHFLCSHDLEHFYFWSGNQYFSFIESVRTSKTWHRLNLNEYFSNK